MNPRKILVTGRNGQLGWELQRALACLGNVIAVDAEDVNLADADAIRSFVRATRPDLIINPAAFTAVDRAETERELAHAVNVTAPAILAEEAKRLGIGLIHYSTDYVYDGTKREPYVETDTPNPLGVYGQTKLEGEEAIRASGVPHLIFRTSWVYGARAQNFMLTMLRLARERSELRIVADQYGAPTWCRLLAETTAQVCAQLLQPQGTNRLEDVTGVYHLTNQGVTTWHGFTEAIVQHMRQHPQLMHELKVQSIQPIATSDYPLPAKRPAYGVLDNSKLQQTFGLTMPDWQLALALCFASV